MRVEKEVVKKVAERRKTSVEIYPLAITSLREVNRKAAEEYDRFRDKKPKVKKQKIEKRKINSDR